MLIKKFECNAHTVRLALKDFYSNFRIIELGSEITEKALSLHQKYKLSFYDSTIIASALAAECEILYSEDMQSGLRIEKNLLVLNPFQSISNV